MFVNLLVMSMCCAKTDELIKMLFGMWTRERRLGLGNHYYVGPRIAGDIDVGRGQWLGAPWRVRSTSL